MNSLYCCQCGASRPLTRERSTGFSLNDVFSMAKLKPIERCRENEIDPQVIVSVQVYRNGGTDYDRTHICDDCQRVVLVKIRDRLNGVLASFGEGQV
jgi:hypothetical protein